VQSQPIAANEKLSSLRLSSVVGMVEALGAPCLICDRSGLIIASSSRAQAYLDAALPNVAERNLFQELLHMDPGVILGQMEDCGAETHLQFDGPTGKTHVDLHCVPDTQWLLVRLDWEGPATSDPNTESATVQALLQEREITYRNLLAAYLRLQEVNRQKTVFLASAAHELKTPLAVIKGYYDLLLLGSLGSLNEKQKEILRESKDSCERLIRLVSMFLNYSALETGKLVLHSRENDIKDCLTEVAARWQEAFLRKHVRLEVTLDSALPRFRFDYQKVQQVVANLVDNALKHTPTSGSVTLTADPYFWERRALKDVPVDDRRQAINHLPNSVRITVADTGAGIAAEHHQEIFEDFVRVDRSSSGIGLGLAIAHRLVQAHRGKIWVDSELNRGSTFSVLLPIENV
jgi:signal transduction histidine kinase